MVDILARRLPAVAPASWLEVGPPMTRFALYGNAGVREAISPLWGPEFSETACRAYSKGSRATLWLGPDEYLLLDAGEPEAGLLSAFERAAIDLPHAFVDVSHRHFALEVSGTHAENILRGACPLDLDATAFPIGMCTRTVFAKAEIVLWRTRENAFHLEVWRSFAGYVTGLLQEIAAEFHPLK